MAGKLIEPTGFLIGDLTHIRIILEDGRWVTRKIPHDKLHITLASLFETGLPTSDEKNFPEMQTWIPPQRIKSIVVFKTDKAFNIYKDCSALTRESIERGFIPREELKKMKQRN